MVKYRSKFYAEFHMHEILKSISEAEAKAAEIKAQALEKASLIAGAAEERSVEIAGLCDAECKA